MYIEILYVLVLLIISSILYIKVAERFNIMDTPNHRSSHKTPTIRGGGILFYIAVVTFFLSSGFSYPYFFIGISLVALISFLDDLFMLPSKTRMIVQFLAVLLCIYEVGLLNEYVLLLPLLIAGVTFLNVYNFMDGINGITGLYSILTLSFLLIINYQEGLILSDLIVYAIISVIVFGYFNFRKNARMFAGDVGSVSMALILLFVGGLFMYKLESLLIFLLFLVYGTDGLLTMAHRIINRENLAVAHRSHIYQKLADVYRYPHLKISLFYTLVQAVINLIVILYYKESLLVQVVIFLVVIIVFFFLYLYIFRQIERKKVKNRE